MRIPQFRGVFTRDNLPKKIWKNERGIVNLDTKFGVGTHWVCYKKIGNCVFYFDSFGNLNPPLELQEYFNGNKILFNYNNHQTFGTVICGHLCLRFLTESV